jgi:hypothetical protein
MDIGNTPKRCAIGLCQGYGEDGFVGTRRNSGELNDLWALVELTETYGARSSYSVKDMMAWMSRYGL